MSHNPFFSIVICTYNSFDFIEKCLDSLLDQSSNDFEVIIVDDGSLSDFQEFLKKLILKPKYSSLVLNLYFQDHKGISFVRNFGVEKSLGRYIYVLDSDDMMVKGILSGLKDFIVQKEYPDLIFGDILIINSKDKIISYRKYKNYSKDRFIRKIFSSFIVPFKHSAMIYKKKSFLNLGGYNESFLRLVDVELFLRFLESKFLVLHYPDFLVKYRYHRKNISNYRIKNFFYWFKLIENFSNFFFFKLKRIFIEIFKIILSFFKIKL